MSGLMNLQAPLALDLSGNQNDSFQKWLKRFEVFLIASEATEKSDAYKIALLTHCGGPALSDIIDTLTTTEIYADLISALRHHFEPRKNTVLERFRLFKLVQHDNEPVSDFVTRVTLQAKKCELDSLEDSLILLVLISGCTSNTTREAVLREGETDLHKVVAALRASEAARASAAYIANEQPAHATRKAHVDAVSTDRKTTLTTSSFAGHSGGRDAPTDRQPCGKCGLIHHGAYCPATRKTCNRCGSKGHFRKCCPKKVDCLRDDVTAVETLHSVGADDSFFVYGLATKGTRWYETFQLNRSVPIRFLIDSGAEVNTIPGTVFNHPALRCELRPLDKPLISYGNGFVGARGKFTANVVSSHGESTSADFVVVADNLQPICGLQLAEELHYITRCNSLQLNRNDPVFQGLGCISGKEYRIDVSPDAVPVAVPPRRVPITLLKQLDAELDRMLSLGVISRVTQATEWVHGLVCVLKKDGSLRVCIDPTNLNKYVTRRRFEIPKPEHLFAKLAGNTVYSTLDANSGFWQLPLHPDSRPLTTFSTHRGRFWFNRLFFGISAGPEYFHESVVDNFADIEGAFPYIDDLIVAGVDRQQHDERLARVLQRCRDIGMTLNFEKCVIGRSSVLYLGHIISAEGLRPDPQKVKAIADMNPPTDATGVKRVMGCVQYVQKFIPSLAEIAGPLRHLTTKDAPFVWTPECESSFKTIKKCLVCSPVLALFDPKRDVVLVNDASRIGLGSCMMQPDDHGELRPVLYASRTMTLTEQNYSQLEKELLAICFGISNARDYVIGRDFDVITDHQSLETITKRELHDTPLRVQRLLLQIKTYNYHIKYQPGATAILAIPDALSRAPASQEGRCRSSVDVEEHVIASVQNLPFSQQRLTEIRQYLDNHPVMSQLMQFTRNGFPATKRQLPPDLAPFWLVRDDLSISDCGLLMKGSRIFIPPDLRPVVLAAAHDGSHQGESRTKELLRSSVWWPGLSRDIEVKVSSCDICARQRSNRAEPLMPHKTSATDLPWEEVHGDCFEFEGRAYLVVHCVTSHFIEIVPLRSQTSKEVVLALKSLFARHGVPCVFTSDNGPCFVSAEFADFKAVWDFDHQTTSPLFPQANGAAERSVQTVKEMMRKNADPYLALLHHRNTPHPATGLSPAQLMYSRTLRTNIPTVKTTLKPRLADMDEVAKRHGDYSTTAETNFNRRHGVRSLDELHVGDSVWVDDPNKRFHYAASVVENLGNRSYALRTVRGALIRRNRRALTLRRQPVDGDARVELTFPNGAHIPDNETPRAPEANVSVDDDVHSDLADDDEPVLPPPVQQTRSGRPIILPPRFR